MKISVVKYTGIEALRIANSFTTGNESRMSLATAYRLGHSPIRTQRFYIYLEDIPLFVASQLVRSHVGVQWYQRSKRTDRGGSDFTDECMRIENDLNNVIAGMNLDGRFDEYAVKDVQNDVIALPTKYDRLAPTSLMADLNAEALINISRHRLCHMASRETREIWEQVVKEVAVTDPYLAPYLVKPCVTNGICREARCCGFIDTNAYLKERDNYRDLFI